MLIGIVMISNLAFGFDESQLQAELERAQHGDCSSQIEVANYYYNQKEFQTALYWLNKVMDNKGKNTDSPKGYACQCLGLMYLYGQGVPQSMDVAEIWWQRGVDYKDYGCADDLIWLYEIASKKDGQKAFQARIKAADLGNYESALIVAMQYEFGSANPKYPVVEKNYAKAINYYRKYSNELESQTRTKQADQNGEVYYTMKCDCLIDYKLAIAYFIGENGVTKDYELAVVYLTRSINSYLDPKPGRMSAPERMINIGKRQLTDDELGDAMWKLSICYRFGRGVRESAIKALEWTQKAAEKGNKNAINLLNKNN
jgi:TPR repeat protein